MAKQNVTLYNIMIGTCSDLDAIGLDTRIVNAVMQWNQANQKGCVCLMPRHWKISSAFVWKEASRNYQRTDY